MVITFCQAKTFTVSDPPMIFIYHFVSYDTTSIITPMLDKGESQGNLLNLPSFNKKDISICANCNVWDEAKGEELVSPEYAEKVSILNSKTI